MRVLILASGNGTNAEALIKAQKGRSYQVVGLASDQAQAKALERAEKLGVRTAVFERKSYDSRLEWEEAIVAWCQSMKAEVLVLAGYMRIVGKSFLEAYPNKIINVHPALLPLFKGKSAIEDAYKAGASRTGVTVHLVDEGIDTGPILSQEALDVDPEWTLEELEERIHQIEHRLYPEAIDRFCQERQ